jgi:KaiC/GvpD/RAD55 family RecA-like ATPase
MIHGYQEQIFYHYILQNPLFLGVTKSDFFTNASVRELFEIAKEHALKYKEPPSKEQMIQLVQIKGLAEKYNDDLVESLYNTKQLLAQYEDQWLEENVGPWIQIRNLDNVIRKVIAYMKTSKVTPDNAKETIEKVRHMLSSETAIDFTFNMGKNFFDAAAHLQTRLARTSTGYDYIDICTKGGYWKGSLMVLFGMPKSGKSMWMCNMAAKSVMMGHNTAYITLELQEELVNMRIGANLLNIPLDDYEAVTHDQDLLKTKLNHLKQKAIKPLGEFHIKEFPSSTASANDISAYLRKAQELLGYKFDNVFIDYLNIMKNWRNANSENTYMKIKQISEDIRAMGQENGWAVISVTQTNRSGWEANDLSITSIAESAGLLHTVDILFGICTDAQMKAKGEYFLKCLANRVAGYENTRKRYTIDWKHARIEEDRNSPIQDMEFFINQVAVGQKYPRGHKSTTTTINAAISNSVTPVDPIPDDIPIGTNETNITGKSLFNIK